MDPSMTDPRSTRPSPALGLVAAVLLAVSSVAAVDDGKGPPGALASFTLPDAWQARFWDDPDTRALRRLDPRALAALVPAQAGLRFCRCPNCNAEETSDPLVWSASRPDKVTCRRCGRSFPDDKVPAKVEGKIPEEAVEVLPGVTHRYRYHKVPEDDATYEDERLYLEAKRDYEAREALAKAALYAAVRARDRPDPAGRRGDDLRFAAVLLLRFAQVYPAYATHYDRPGRPKSLQRADLPPPYRRGYRTGKWDWTASLDVPLNLVIAYAIVRDAADWAEVGRLLDDANPRRTIETGLFRASAEFVRRQADESDELSLQADRGLFAVARLLDDPELLAEARGRLAIFAERGFYHDGSWRQGNAAAHRRVVRQLDGWIGRLDAGTPGPVAPGPVAASGVPLLDLARAAASAPIPDAGPEPDDVQLASWPAPPDPPSDRRPALLGGVGLARLSVGKAADGLDIEVRGMGNLGAPHYQRQAIRVAVGGRPVLDDLDALPPSPDGWDLATASHNTVVVDGLNQRETPMAAREAVGGSRFLYYAADPDFQVVAAEDPLAYPKSTTRYRQVIVAASGPSARYGVGVFQVHGGLQHDQVFHASAGDPARWATSTSLGPGPETLLPPTILHLPNTRAEDGRWFVQAMGEFRGLAAGRSDGPMTATLAGPGRPGVRLHLLGPAPVSVYAGLTPDPTGTRPAPASAEPDEGRASLVLRRRSADGSSLASTFVTVFEPTGVGPALKRVGRVASAADAVVLSLETADGDEHLVINLRPGTAQAVRLADGTTAATDGLALQLGPTGMHLAGGTFARAAGTELRQDRTTGRVVGAGRQPGDGSRGWFEVEGRPEAFAGVEGRCLLIRHGDGTVHGWTVRAVEPAGRKSVRLRVVEEPGFLVDPTTADAIYYQFPRTTLAGPHQASISRLARTVPLR